MWKFVETNFNFLYSENIFTEQARKQNISIFWSTVIVTSPKFKNLTKPYQRSCLFPAGWTFKQHNITEQSYCKHIIDTGQVLEAWRSTLPVLLLGIRARSRSGSINGLVVLHTFSMSNLAEIAEGSYLGFVMYRLTPLM